MVLLDVTKNKVVDPLATSPDCLQIVTLLLKINSLL